MKYSHLLVFMKNAVYFPSLANKYQGIYIYKLEYYLIFNLI
jgi:hypothetical protein